VLDAESSRSTIVPGEWVALYGANLTGVTRTWAQSDFTSAGTGNLPTNLSGVTVQFNGLPAAVFSSARRSWTCRRRPASRDRCRDRHQQRGHQRGLHHHAVQNAPSLFYYPAGSNLYPAAVHADGTLIGDPAVASTATKAKAGETIILFVNGAAPSPSGVLIAERSLIRDRLP